MRLFVLAEKHLNECEKYMGILFTMKRMVVLVYVRNILVRGLEFGFAMAVAH